MADRITSDETRTDRGDTVVHGEQDTGVLPGTTTHDEPPTRRFGRSGDRHEVSGGARAAGVASATAGTSTDRVRDRQRAEFGGFNWGAAFFGYLVAVGITVLLTGILSAAGAAIGLTETTGAEATANAETIGIVGGVLLLAVVGLAYYLGGYVAGRMSRFDGGRQGFGVWVLGLVVAVSLGVLAVIAGDEYNVIERAGLPSLPVGEETLTTGGLIATALILLVTALAAIGGGKSGERYHRKVDQAGGLLD